MNGLDREALHLYRGDPAEETDLLAAVSDVCEICRRARREPRSRTCSQLHCYRMLEALDELRSGGPPSWRLTRG